MPSTTLYGLAALGENRQVARRVRADFLVELRGFEPLISVVRAPCAPRDGATLKTQFVTMFEDGLLA